MSTNQADKGKVKPCPNGCGTQVFFESRFGEDGELITKDDGKTKWWLMEDASKQIHKCPNKAMGFTPQRKSGQSEQVATVWATAEPDDKGYELGEGEKAFENIAYHLVKERHPDISDQSNLFGQMVNAKESHLIMLALIKAIKGVGKNETS